MRISRINPRCLSDKEKARLLSGKQTRTKRFGSVRLATAEDKKILPDASSPDSDTDYPDYLSIVW